MSTENTLAKRYASEDMLVIWDDEHVVFHERMLWVLSLRLMLEHGVLMVERGVTIDLKVLEEYVRVADKIDLESIAELERVLQHDVVARKREFDKLAGHSLAHRAFTSRDATDNMEQLRILSSLQHVRDRSVPVLVRLDQRIREWMHVAVCGRSHGQVGQVTTYGKRMATIAEEFLYARHALDDLIKGYSIRGFKGAMGTSQDLLAELKGQEALDGFEQGLCTELFSLQPVFDSVGQIYPRSLDFHVISTLFLLAGAPGNFSRFVRDNSRMRHLSEGFSDGRKGSSAMPHKKNPSKSERIKALKSILKGYAMSAGDLVGDQEFEGDVSCSALRREILPNAFYAIDGILDTMMVVLDQMELYPEVIKAELEEELPFLSTTAIRGLLRESGMDDTEAYESIQKHSLAASRDICAGKGNTLLARLADDEHIAFSLKDLKQACVVNFGDAERQAERVLGKIKMVIDGADPSLRGYTPKVKN